MSAETLIGDLASKGWSVALAESCTGGMIAQSLTEVAGASAVFGLGIVSYSNAMKSEVLGVPEQLIEQHGAVSAACVGAMVDGVQALSSAEFCAAVSGIAGPSGATEDKPVGTVWVGLGRHQERWQKRYWFDGDRNAVRQATSAAVFASLSQLVRGEDPW